MNRYATPSSEFLADLLRNLRAIGADLYASRVVLQVARLGVHRIEHRLKAMESAK